MPGPPARTMTTEPKISHNILANFGGKLWTAGIAIVFVPIYIRILGAEAYGLVGFFVSLQLILSLMEMGLGTTATKEMARLSVSPNSKTVVQMRNLVRTLELVYLGLGIIVVSMVFVGSGPLSAHWFKPVTISPREIGHAIVIMGFVIGVRMQFSLYSGALNGLQHQVVLNVITVAFVTVKHLGAVAALLFISEDITVFFLWHLFAELGQTALTRCALKKKLPPSSDKARFQFEQIKGIWRFAAGMTGVAITNVVLSQTDKLFVSKVFPLETFGYYSAMWTIAGGLFFFSYPIAIAAFPRYAQLWEACDTKNLALFYHRTSRLTATVMLPLGICVLLFSREILSIWLGAPQQAIALENVLRLLVAGTILNALFNLPMNLQFATGWTRLVFYTNLLWLICFPFTMWWLTSEIGLAGVPTAWLFYNIFAFSLVAYIAHKRLLNEGLSAWYLKDIGIPLVAGGAVICALFYLIPLPAGTIGQAIAIASCATLGMCGSAATLEAVRSRLARTLSRWVV